MLSPFPRMDPHLEAPAGWQGFHSTEQKVVTVIEGPSPERAGHDYRLPYDRKPEPPLRLEDAQWAKERFVRWRKGT